MERFDLESANFTRTFIPVGSTTTPEMTSLLPVGSYRSSKAVENSRIRRLRCGIYREPFEVESPNFTGTSVTTCPTYAPDMTSPATSGRKLQ